MFSEHVNDDDRPEEIEAAPAPEPTEMPDASEGFALAERAAYESGPDLIVLPETALPGPLGEHLDWKGQIVRLASRSRSTCRGSGS